jgi:hypothetical protein
MAAKEDLHDKIFKMNQVGTNASKCSGIMLKNSNTLVEQMSYI